MRGWDARRVAAAAGATLVRRPSGVRDAPGPAARERRLARGSRRASCSSACAASAPTAARYAAQALRGGRLGRAGGARARARRRRRRRTAARCSRTSDPLAGLQALARAWRRELRARGAKVVAITGSTGKTSTKDILAALLGAPPARGGQPGELQHRDRAAAGDARRAGRDARCSCSRWRCAAPGQIARADRDRRARRRRDRQRRARPPRAARLARGDRGRQGRADRRAWRRGASVVVPAGEPLLAPHLRADRARHHLRRGR